MKFFDFEYRNKYNRDDIVLVSFHDSHTKQTDSFYGATLEDVKQYVEDNIDDYFICFVANADLVPLLTLGVDVRKLKFVDIYLLWLQLAYTHKKYYTEQPSLVNALKAFDIDGGYSDTEKVDTVELILSKAEYTAEEMELIRLYCEKDTQCLAPLLGLMLAEVAELTNTDAVTVLDVLEFHGAYLTAVAHADYYNKGFPVNVERLDDVYDNVQLVKEELAKKVNETYCEGMYKPIYKHVLMNHRDNTITNKWTFNHDGFEDFITRSGLYEAWPKTDTGKLSTKGEDIESQIRGAPYLMLLYRTRKTNQDLNDKKDLREWLVDGHIKGKSDGFWMSKPYGTKTYRNSPKPANGFLLNKTPWMRVALVEPKRGKSMVSCDWSAQEIAISASLSGDNKLRDLYNQKRTGGDIYLYMAVKAGSAPEGATKETHGAIRDMFKVVLLGLSYGMGIQTLGESLYKSRFVDGEATLSLGDALEKAEQITAWHKEYFYVFWGWVSASKDMAYARGYLRTLDGLVYFVDTNSRPTAVQNYPVQSAAAVMMRLAFQELVSEGLDVICSLHDAFYVTCNEEDAETVARTVEKCMEAASDMTIGEFCPVLCEAKIQHHGEWFNDDRANDALEVIKPLFKWK